MAETVKPVTLDEKNLLVFRNPIHDDWYIDNIWTRWWEPDGRIRKWVLRKDFIFSKTGEDVPDGWIYEGTLYELALRYKWAARPSLFRERVDAEGKFSYTAAFYCRPNTINPEVCPKIIEGDDEFETWIKRVDKRDMFGQMERFLPYFIPVLYFGSAALALLIFAVGRKTMWQGRDEFLVAFFAALVGLSCLIASTVYFAQHDVFEVVDAVKKSIREVVPIDELLSVRKRIMYALLYVGVMGTGLFISMIWVPLYWIVAIIIIVWMLYRYSQRPEPEVEEGKIAPPPPPEAPKTTVEQVLADLFKKK
jgi:hypothetical protein